MDLLIYRSKGTGIKKVKIALKLNQIPSTHTMSFLMSMQNSSLSLNVFLFG